MFDLEKVLLSLADKRKIFHSEADFQFALAWEMQEIYGDDVKIRLEFPLRIEYGNSQYIDIVVKYGGQLFPIELKYATDICSFEEYRLTNQGAKDIKVYDFCKDIERVECYIGEHDNCEKGYCIFLTNHIGYSRNSGRKSGAMEFHIYESAVKTGVLDWGENIGAGTKKGRETPITIKGSYTMRWQPYSEVSTKGYGKFIFNFVEVS